MEYQKQYIGGDAGMGSSAGYATASTRETFMSTVEAAHEHINMLEDRVRTLADRLCGPMPPTPQEALSNRIGLVSSGGAFDLISEHARDIIRRTERINDDLNRIERALP